MYAMNIKPSATIESRALSPLKLASDEHLPAKRANFLNIMTIIFKLVFQYIL